MKQEVFAALEAVVRALRARDEHVVALGRRDGRRLRRPERVVGMHFFNPVALMPLVELVRAPETDDARSRPPGRREKLRKRPSSSPTRPGSSSTAC